MTALADLWTPPAGMLPDVAAGWKTFYRGVLDTYGITPAQYRALYLGQLGRCFICQSARGKHPDDPKGKGGRRLGVDHNHVFGNTPQAVRGLLCTGGGPGSKKPGCNWIIGCLEYRALQRAVEYVAEAPGQAVLALLAGGAGDDRITGSAY